MCMNLDDGIAMLPIVLAPLAVYFVTLGPRAGCTICGWQVDRRAIVVEDTLTNIITLSLMMRLHQHIDYGPWSPIPLGASAALHH